MKQGEFATEKERVREIKKRIQASLREATDTDCRSDGVIINNSHLMHFRFGSKDYLLIGTISKRMQP